MHSTYRADGWMSLSTARLNRWLLEDLAAPLSKRPFTQIKPVEVLNLLRRIERTGRRETATGSAAQLAASSAAAS
jgi:hypothetical protein